MAKLSKRIKAIREQVQPGKLYPVLDAFTLLKSIPPLKFVESVDVAVNLGVDSRKSEQVVRGSTILPHRCSKTVRVAVFTQGANADAAKQRVQISWVLKTLRKKSKMAKWIST
ncbi:MAG: hypothetical protein R3E08_05045 [Thiotrichaceae bacterium]